MQPDLRTSHVPSLSSASGGALCRCGLTTKGEHILVPPSVAGVEAGSLTLSLGLLRSFAI